MTLEEIVNEFLEDILFALEDDMRIKILQVLIKADKPLTSEFIYQNAGIKVVDEADMLNHLSELVRLGYVGMVNTIPKVYYITSFMREIIRLYLEFNDKERKIPANSDRIIS